MSRMKWWGWGDEERRLHARRTSPSSARSSSATSTSTSTASPRARSRFDELDVPEPLLARRPARRARGGRRRRARLDRRRSTASSTRAARACATSSATARGDLGRLPDVVVRPGSEDGRSRRSCARSSTPTRSLIPFGGGTNISGSLEAPGRRGPHGRLRRPRRGWTASSRSTTARGSRACRPARSARRSRRQLNARGWTIGHFPDSFTHSTLGGWIATRSSGMQSDKYGDVADLTRAVRVVTPAGMLVTRPVPHDLDRPERARDDPRQRGPPRDHHRGDGARAPRARAPHDPRLPLPRLARARCAAMRAIAESDAAPSVTRVSDAPETRVLVRHAEGADGARPR